MATQLFSKLGGIDPEKLSQHRATFICQYGLHYCIAWPSFLFYCFVKFWATCENFLGKWFTAPPGKKLPIRLCLLIHRHLIKMYKCLNGQVPAYLSSNIIKRSDVHKISTWQSSDINLSRFRTSLAQRSFFYRAAKRWNELDYQIKTSPSLRLFKKAVKNLRFQ